MRLTGKELAEYCLELLARKGKNEAEFSRAVGVTQAGFFKWKSGKVANPKLDFVVKVANYFNITVSELIGETPMSFPDDIKEIANMLLYVGERDRSAISALVRTYYDAEMGKKEFNGDVAG